MSANLQVVPVNSEVLLGTMLVVYGNSETVAVNCQLIGPNIYNANMLTTEKKKRSGIVQVAGPLKINLGRVNVESPLVL